MAATDQGINVCSITEIKQWIDRSQNVCLIIMLPHSNLPNDKFWVAFKKRDIACNHHTKGGYRQSSAGWMYSEVNFYPTPSLWLATSENGLLQQSLTKPVSSVNQLPE
jgi:hypothetical protein